MAENTEISWTDHTFNHIRGCTKISPACENCYADTMSGRNPSVLGVWGKHGTRTIAAESYWKLPIKWNKQAESEGVRKRVFCASLADVFEGEDTTPADAWLAVQEARGRLWNLIENTPNLDWLLLTKRPENVMSLVSFEWRDNGFPPNVWIGTTVENQKYADIRIPELLKIPAKVRFLSVEPMLGPIDLTKKYIYMSSGIAVYPLEGYYAERGNTDDDGRAMWDGDQWNGNRIDWIICGGESGHKARPMHPDWVRTIRDQCVEAEVPFHFKQWGEYQPFSDLSGVQITPFGSYNTETKENFLKRGKAASGCLLDGREWNELPEVHS